MLYDTSFSQLTLAENTDIKNLFHETLHPVISQSWSRRKQTQVRKFYPAVSKTNKQLSGCAERIAVLSLLINHKIIVATAVP